MKRLLSAAAALLLMASPAFAVFNSVENFPFSNISATTAAFVLRGGTYGLTCHATWGGGNVTLQRLATDGSSWVPVMSQMTADAYASASLPSGSYRLAVTTATGVYCDAVAVETIK